MEAVTHEGGSLGLDDAANVLALRSLLLVFFGKLQDGSSLRPNEMRSLIRQVAEMLNAKPEALETWAYDEEASEGKSIWLAPK